ncbi:MAG TPA: adenylate/guanylate cyclase domain-containing protein [Candidatus Binataceae bacterium]|nr:adenylate/guanylate cyclase domain-containing protein [Candidatus Binataceae bacterium]
MRCTKCGTESTTGRKFCPACGGPLSNRCPKCGAENAPTSAFCEDCGSALAVNAAPAAQRSSQIDSPAPNIRVAAQQAEASALEGERKTVTALFADIKGSTELEQDLDPEEARAIIDPALKLMIDAVRRYDGYIVQSTGDGIFALFGAPVAHEDHPQRALYAALRMQEELKRYSARLREVGNLPIEARVGVNTGEVVVRSIATGEGHTEYTPIGHTANLASRMQGLAPTGSIATSEATRKFCEGYFTLKPLGPTKVKGVSETVNVYEVTGLGPLRTRLQRSAGRGLTKFVGRQREMDAMKAAAEQAEAGHGQIVAAMAEPGVGKSRLFYEFKVKHQSGWMVLETFSVSHGRASAFLPVLDMLHGYFKISSDDDARARREKIGGKVLMLDRALEDTLPYLFALLGIVEGDNPLAQMDAQIRKRRTLDAIKRLLLRESLNQPLMVIFEDLHWIDEETQALLNLLADSIGTAKLLLLVNYRPEYSHQWNSKTYYTQLRLDPLGREGADEVLTVLVGDGAEVRPLKRLIIERTEGNPFFMEETVQVLLDEGALVRNGTVKLTKALGELKIPPTVQGILAARIDGLPADGKELLQTLAVFGREFAFGLLRSVVTKSEEELNRLLHDLQLAEFIYEQPAAGDIEYTFKHALTQELAYNSILSERRKMLHERAARAIESLYVSSLDDHLADLVRHYRQSENGAKAVEYLCRAGEQAAQRAAYSEAEAYLDAGLERVRTLPESPGRSRAELRIQICKGQLIQATTGLVAPDAILSYKRARELCTLIGDNAQLFLMLDGLRWSSLFRLELAEARHLAEEQIALAGRLSDPAYSALASGALGEVLLWIGDFAAARRCLEPLVSPGFGDLRGPALQNLVVGRSILAQVLLMLGFGDQAIKRRDETLAWVRGLGLPDPTATAFNIASRFDLWCRSPQSALEHSRICIETSIEHGLGREVWMATIMKGWALSYQGQVGEGITEMRGGIKAAESTGVVIPTWCLFPLAEEYLRAGRSSEADELVDQMLERVQSTGNGEDEADVYRLKGELSMMRDAPDKIAAEKWFRAAIEVARRQSAKLYELRATMSLARLLRDTGRHDEARAMLAEIYNWFTEGVDTADLKDAKTLLEELRA